MQQEKRLRKLRSYLGKGLLCLVVGVVLYPKTELLAVQESDTAEVCKVEVTVENEAQETALEEVGDEVVLLTAGQAESETTEATLVVGETVRYEDWVTNYFYVNGTLAYCLQAKKQTPNDGSYVSCLLEENELLTKALYYLYGGPGFSEYEKAVGGYFGGESAEAKYAYSHVMLSYIYCGADGFEGVSEQSVAVLKCELAILQAMPEVPSSDLEFSPDVVETYYDWEKRCQRTEEITFLAEETNTVTFTLPQEITLHNSTTKEEQTGTVTIKGGDSFSLTADVMYEETFFSGALTGSNTIAWRALVLQTGEDTQDIGSGFYYVDTDSSASFTVEWKAYTGKIRLQKTDGQTKQQVPQGGGSLAGAVYEIVREGEVVDCIVTDENGQGISQELPLGVVYEIREQTPSDGYLLDETIYSVDLAPNSAEEAEEFVLSKTVTEDVIRGGVRIAKQDRETGQTQAQGKASLAGAEFEIVTSNAHSVVVDGKGYEKGEVVATVLTDETGIAMLQQDQLPYGTYLVREVSAPQGYLLQGVTQREFQILENAVIVELTETAEGILDEVKRGDLKGVKIAEASHERLGGVSFEITSVSTGESHVIVTDENGQFSTEATWALHSRNTNQGETAEDGIWFSGYPEGEEGAPVDDEAGALPYDTYQITELACESNVGYELIPSFEVVITKDQVTVDLGTLTDGLSETPEEKIIEIFTEATAGEDRKTVTEGETIEIIDTVTLKNLTVGTEYLLKGSEWLKEEATQLIVDGQEVTGEYSFTAKSQEMEVEIVFEGIDTTNLGACQLVAFEELYDNTDPDTPVPVAEHKDLSAKEQTITVEKSETPENTVSQTVLQTMKSIVKTGDSVSRLYLYLLAMLVCVAIAFRNRTKGKPA